MTDGSEAQSKHASVSSSHPSSSTSDDTGDSSLLPLLPSSELGDSKTNPKGLRFEEEPSDSYIVRSKSAILRCKTLNALNSWFTCNSGEC